MAITSPVAAFSAFRRILKTNGRLAFVCWRSLAENEVDIFPLRAAGLEHLADPTPFSFEDPIYVRHVLAKAGFRDIAIAAYDLSVSSGGLDAMVTVLTTVWAE